MLSFVVIVDNKMFLFQRKDKLSAFRSQTGDKSFCLYTIKKHETSEVHKMAKINCLINSAYPFP